MRTRLLVFASVMAAMFVLGPASASAQSSSPTLLICPGGAQSDGSFQGQEINTGELPAVGGLGLSLTACLGLNADRGAAFAQNLADTLSNLEPPSETPTPEDIQAIIDAIAEVDPSSPLAALELAFATCTHLHVQQQCSALLGAVLSAPLPLGDNVQLEGESGSCFQGTQSGTGQAFAGGEFYRNMEWTADYTSTGNLVGLVNGTAQSGFGSNAKQHEVTGLIGPGCGAGAKLAVLVIQ